MGLGDKCMQPRFFRCACYSSPTFPASEGKSKYEFTYSSSPNAYKYWNKKYISSFVCSLNFYDAPQETKVEICELNVG